MESWGGREQQGRDPPEPTCPPPRRPESLLLGCAPSEDALGNPWAPLGRLGSAAEPGRAACGCRGQEGPWGQGSGVIPSSSWEGWVLPPPGPLPALGGHQTGGLSRWGVRCPVLPGGSSPALGVLLGAAHAVRGGSSSLLPPWSCPGVHAQAPGVEKGKEPRVTGYGVQGCPCQVPLPPQAWWDRHRVLCSPCPASPAPACARHPGAWLWRGPCTRPPPTPVPAAGHRLPTGQRAAAPRRLQERSWFQLGAGAGRAHCPGICASRPRAQCHTWPWGQGALAGTGSHTG